MTRRSAKKPGDVRPYYGDHGEPERSPLRAIWFWLAIVFAALFGTVTAWPAKGQALASPSERAWLLTWIPAKCCVTNNCCYRSVNGEAKGLAGDRWLVAASGQILPRTAWSRDGSLWLCQCDQNGRGGWIVHPAAYARCVFPPAPGS